MFDVCSLLFRRLLLQIVNLPGFQIMFSTVQTRLLSIVSLPHWENLQRGLQVGSLEPRIMIFSWCAVNLALMETAART